MACFSTGKLDIAFFTCLVRINLISSFSFKRVFLRVCINKPIEYSGYNENNGFQRIGTFNVILRYPSILDEVTQNSEAMSGVINFVAASVK